MIAARQIFLGRGGGAKLPYDAEVEYLESTGTQYIDTHVYGKNNQLVRCEFYVPETFSYTAFPFGCAQSARNRFIFSHTDIQVTVGAMTATSTVSIDNVISVWHTIELNSTPDNQTASIDGNIIAQWNVASVTPTIYPFHLFAIISNRGAIQIGDGRISSFEVVDLETGQKLISFKSVRKGNVGYMYDRVSGKLFGNAGTGAFLYGNDK